MSRAKKIKYFVLHCTAGYGTINSILNYWKSVLQWDYPGYGIIIDLDGVKWYVTKNRTYSKDKKEWYPEMITNGVLGFNTQCIHIATIGGVSRKDYTIAEDTRTDAQKVAILEAIYECYQWLDSEGVNLKTQEIRIQGHRDFSPDKNGNGIIESWERIKDCPSYDAIPEYDWLDYQCLPALIKWQYSSKGKTDIK